MTFNYQVLTPLAGVKRFVVRNPKTDFLKVTYIQSEKEFTIEKIQEGKYLIEAKSEGYTMRRFAKSLVAVDATRCAFFGA